MGVKGRHKNNFFCKKQICCIILGPDLPATCAFASPSMITTLDGKGVILVGCLDMNTGAYDKIYELSNINNELTWKILDKKLKYPRSGRPVVSFIPDEFVTCV